MKFRSRRILSESTAPLAWGLGRAARLGKVPKPDTRVERFYYSEQRLMAAPIPKVASRTFKQMFQTLSDGAPSELACNPEEIRPQFPDFYIFSFTRNPWSRIYSCWKDKVADAVTPGKVSILSRFSGLRPFMPFEEFVEWLATEAGSDSVADRHWMSQVRHLDAGDGRSLCNFVGQMEQLDAGLSQVEQQTGIALPRPEKVNAKTAGGEYRTAFSERARQMIAERYAADIETYKYRFDDEVH
ncbi:MAG: sulfotransferase family 2 domain-containing protein [Pseudomonadota bacterium]